MNKTLIEYRLHFETVLTHYLNTLDSSSTQLLNAMHYACQDGKRMRPLLVYATGFTFNLPISILDPIAIATEMIHVYSLIHDDLPAMDNDDFRRGRASCHKAFGEATALLAGNALQTQAFKLLTEQNLDPDIQLNTIRILTTAIGLEGMMAGQDLDLIPDKKSVQEIELIHRLKTGKLLEACVLIPAYVTKQPDLTLRVLKKFIDAAGRAFQIQDDLEDLKKEEYSSFAQQQGIEKTVTSMKILYQTAEQELDKISQSQWLSAWLKTFIGIIFELTE